MVHFFQYICVNKIISKDMKQIILTLGLIFSASIAMSQISIVHSGETEELNGSVYTKMASGTVDQEIDLHVMNNYATDKYLKITRTRLNVPEADWSDYICWGEIGDAFGGTCYLASANNPWTTPGSGKLIAAGEGGLLAVHIDPSDLVNGTGQYRYYVVENDVKLDSIDVTVTTTTASVKETKSTNVVLSSFPNPASEMLTVSLQNANTEGTLRITDVLGKVVYEEKIIGTKKIDVEDFKNGVYLLNLTSSGTKTTKRIVVKH